MKKIDVFLANWDVIKIVSPNEISEQPIYVINDDEIYAECFYKDYHYIKPNHVYYFYVNNKIKLGKDYFLHINNSLIRIDVTPSSLLPDFDNIFAYDKDDLGNVYLGNNSFQFTLWCPHATKVYVEFKYNENLLRQEMTREDKGIFRTVINNLNDDLYYRYVAIINGKEVVAADPYSKYGFNNLEFSVASKRQFNIDLNIDKLTPLNRIEHIIYETNVRDMTIHHNSNIVNKGKFIGLAEENRITKNNHPAGLDYLKYLSITTLQLQPIFNIATINEKNPSEKYNWGYDPSHYFVLEGSYSSNYLDPTQVVEDFLKLVSKLHENNIRLSIDVVYNHLYNAKTSILEKLVPYYYFRREPNWKFQNHCGCGADFSSERFMARKMIIDSLTYLIRDLGVDAIRFDLMGLIDINTISIAYRKMKKIRPDIYFYGEGWEMGGQCHDYSKLLTLENAKEIPEIGYFNDRYRNIVKGIGSLPQQTENGFVLGNQNFASGFKFVFSGSVTNLTYPSLFVFPSQSVNYLECHDNCALFDTIKESMNLIDDDIVLKYLDLFNKTLLLSIGVCFIHAGQEIGFSKKNHHNTYNEGDEFNNFDYDLLDERFDKATLMRNLILHRKNRPIYKIDNALEIKDVVTYTDINKGIVINLKDGDIKTHILLNPSLDTIYYSFDKDKQLIILDKKSIINTNLKINNAMVPPISYLIVKE